MERPLIRVMFFQSWLMFATSLVTNIIFKAFVKEEEQYLEKTFGQAYLYEDRDVRK